MLFSTHRSINPNPILYYSFITAKSQSELLPIGEITHHMHKHKAVKLRPVKQ